MNQWQQNVAQATPFVPASQWTQPQQAAPQLVSVKGLAGAQAYQTPFNSTVALFDADEDVFYLKTVDGMGVPSIRVFDFAERVGDASGEYATKADLESLNSKLDQLIGALQ